MLLSCVEAKCITQSDGKEGKKSCQNAPNASIEGKNRVHKVRMYENISVKTRASVQEENIRKI